MPEIKQSSSPVSVWRVFALYIVQLYWLFILVVHSSGHPLELTIPFDKLTDEHNKQASLIGSDVSSETYNDYKGYSVEDITSIVTPDMARRSLMWEGSFQRLLHSFDKKVREFRQGNANSVVLNILYIGGSVCVGHACYIAPQCTNHSRCGVSTESAALASRHCSWPLRLSFFLEYAFNRILPDVAAVRISPRYCCRAATSSVKGMDCLVSRSYATGGCWVDKLSSTNIEIVTDSEWEPDLILWDYGVNDISNQWFRRRNRKDVYEGLVLKTLSMPSRPQLIDLEFYNRRKDLKPHDAQYLEDAIKDRVEINKKYNIPMVSYLKAIGMDQAPNLTPLYAAQENERHPAWPTHVIWAQLVTEVLMLVMKEESVSGEAAVHSENEDHSLQWPTISNSLKWGLCFSGFSTYMDFDGRPEAYNLEAVRVHRGNWELRNDISNDPYKTGWVIESRGATIRRLQSSSYRRKIELLSNNTVSWSRLRTAKLGNSTTERRSVEHGKHLKSHVSMTIGENQHCLLHGERDDNLVQFKCENQHYDRVKIGYIASYGEEWGTAKVFVEATINRSLPYFNQSTLSDTEQVAMFGPFYVQSRWHMPVSIEQQLELHIKTMESSVSELNDCLRNSDGKTSCFDDINVYIKLCTSTGRKFKVVSFACC